MDRMKTCEAAPSVQYCPDVISCSRRPEAENVGLWIAEAVWDNRGDRNRRCGGEDEIAHKRKGLSESAVFQKRARSRFRRENVDETLRSVNDYVLAPKDSYDGLEDNGGGLGGSSDQDSEDDDDWATEDLGPLQPKIDPRDGNGNHQLIWGRKASMTTFAVTRLITAIEKSTKYTGVLILSGCICCPGAI
ncbi:hypothetical protein Landi51_09311 [Colletotrichum acutatum]